MKMIAVLIAIAAAFGVGSYIGADKACGEECVKGVNVTMGSMSVADFSEAVKAGDATLIDVRTEDEYDEGHIAGAIQQDYYQSAAFESFLDNLEKDEKYLIYCRSDNRSGQVLELMQEKGFSNTSDLSGGISAWKSAGYPVEQ